VGCRPRDVRGGRGRLEREVLVLDERHQATPAEGGERALRCCIRVLLEVVSFDTHSLSAGPDLLHGVRNVVRQVT
jgi:hypothetical protein